jgi:pimeloyl-ACP methyl ester carboxylesterase
MTCDRLPPSKMRMALNDQALSVRGVGMACMPFAVTRHYVQIGQRLVHYRRAGAGPPVLLLHQSPKTSADILPMMQALLAARDGAVTVLAPDTPGYGLSDPLPDLPDHPDIGLFAEACVQFLNALSIGQVAVYGFHTGAMIATALTARYPQRVSALAANGVLVSSAAERADYLEHYLPRFEPVPDGSHLAWLWHRMQVQSVFFPWYRASAATRLDLPLPTAERIQNHVADFLLAGDHYRHAYAAALGCDIAGDLSAINRPVLFLCAKADPLARYLSQIAVMLPAGSCTRLTADADESHDIATRFLLDHLPDDPVPPIADTTTMTERRIVNFDSGALHLRVSGIGERHTRPPLLLLHAPGASSRQIDKVPAELLADRLVLIPDLPGHGDTDIVEDGRPGYPRRCAEILLNLLDRLDVATCALAAIGDSAAIAGMLVEQAPTRILSVTAIGRRTSDPSAPPIPDFTPDSWGGHLLRAWHFARQRALFDPWWNTSPSGICRDEPDLSAESLQIQVTDLLKSNLVHARVAVELAKTGC